ncbi:MAG TPA: tripartite tricarboxylate transporter substrate binding protein [Burkholderiales bacterium]|nr:tripartite tricarboxylate transporter substrate binding protein [Burkholderiales bacterium]
MGHAVDLRLTAGLCAALVWELTGLAHGAASAAGNAAADYPRRPIRFIEAFGSGGTTDVLSRVLGQKLTERLGQQVIVDNRPGAGGNIGAQLAAKALPDGYTLFMGVVPILAAAGSMYGKLGYDVLKDFTDIGLVVSGNYVLVVGSTVPAKSVQEFIALARTRGAALRYSSSGVGSTLHLSMAMLNSMAGLKMLHVPYKGGPPMITAVAAGEVDAGAPSITLALPLIKAGRLTPLGVTGAKRAREFPNLPTIAESGVPGYELTPWYAAYAPASTPKAVVNLLNSELNAILQLPDIKSGFVAQGLEAAGGTPERARQVLEVEVAKWSKVIREAGIKAE